jgi:photosystem II stability/assembly factor-like uncharacterized protein
MSFNSYTKKNSNKENKSLWKKNNGSGSNDWTCINISNDGTKILAGGGNRLYKSSDSELTWTQLASTISTGSWRAVCQTSDGQIMAAAIYNGLLYKSTDGGASWTSIVGSTQSWLASYVSSDENTFIFACYGDGLYMSTNVKSTSTFTFARVNNTVGKRYVEVWISNDRLKIYAIGEISGLDYTTNGGNTWSNINISGAQLYSLDASIDGSRVIFGGDNGRMYMSTNSLYSYSEITINTPKPNPKWRSVSSSSDGKILICSNFSNGTVGDGSIHTSIDSGVTWTTESILSYPSIKVKCSRDGKYLVVCFIGEFIYTRQIL